MRVKVEDWRIILISFCFLTTKNTYMDYGGIVWSCFRYVRKSFILAIIDFSYNPPIKSTNNLSYITIKINASFFPVLLFTSTNP
jgi:hypothetical protein